MLDEIEIFPNLAPRDVIDVQGIYIGVYDSHQSRERVLRRTRHELDRMSKPFSRLVRNKKESLTFPLMISSIVISSTSGPEVRPLPFAGPDVDSGDELRGVDDSWLAPLLEANRPS